MIGIILKKVYQKFRRKNFLASTIDELRSNSAFTDFRISKKYLEGWYKEDFFFKARLHPHSDILVLKQVFLNREYKPLVDFIKDNPNISTLRVIDAGANVGYFTIYLRAELKNATIICVEPDTGNASLLKENLESLINNGEVFVVQGALMGKSSKNMLIDRSFRDGSDWSLSVLETT